MYNTMSAGILCARELKYESCIETETDVGESLQSQFSFFQCDSKGESREVPEGFWAAC